MAVASVPQTWFFGLIIESFHQTSLPAGPSDRLFWQSRLRTEWQMKCRESSDEVFLYVASVGKQLLRSAR
jgi:hypothetical protein